MISLSVEESVLFEARIILRSEIMVESSSCNHMYCIVSIAMQQYFKVVQSM